MPKIDLAKRRRHVGNLTTIGAGIDERLIERKAIMALLHLACFLAHSAANHQAKPLALV